MTRPGEFPPDVVDTIWDRDKGRCAMCGKRLDRERRGAPGHAGGWSIQHREARGKGGVKRKNARPWLTLASNGVLMCGDGVSGCHGDVETKHREWARAFGFVVSALRVFRPAEVPIKHAVYGWVLLLDDGTVESAEAAA